MADTKLFDFHMKFACSDRLSYLISSAESIFEKNNISGEMNLELQLVLEEAISNTINYGYGGKGGYLALSAKIKDDILELEIRDHAKEFNPEIIPSPDLTLPPEEREIGGLGVHMIREIMDNIVYKYEMGENILLMTKKIK